MWDLCKSNSWAEIRARSRMKNPMWFGDEYAYILLHFTVTVALGISSPLIAPFGVLYLAIKHAVDSYRLRTRAVATSVSIELHVLAIGFVLGAAVLLQFYNMLFFNIRVEAGRKEATALTSGFLAILSGAIFQLQVDSGWTWPMPVLPRQAKKMERLAAANDARVNAIYKPDIYVTKEDVARWGNEEEEEDTEEEHQGQFQQIKRRRRPMRKRVTFFTPRKKDNTK